jgi:hypothetical protein
MPVYQALNGFSDILGETYLTLSLNEEGIMLSKESVEGFQRIFIEHYG